MSESMLGIIIVLVGVFSIAASILNWDWYFNNRKAMIFVKLFGRDGARLVYGILGIVIGVVGIFLAAGAR